jgi:UDP-N-acetylmuramate dehydrogenase
MVNALRGELQENIPLSEWNTWRVGGLAKRCYLPADKDDLAVFLQGCAADEPLLWLGLGSNTLIRDKGFNGTVIITQGHLKELSELQPGVIRAEAGVSCAQVARFSARAGYTHCEFLAGIPGTIGGALAMNAGCFGHQTWEQVIAVETVDRRGQITQRTPKDYKIAYREVTRPTEEWFIAAHFEFPRGDKEMSLATIKELLDKRAASQPTGKPCCGSVFRNPPGDFSGRLIEASGLKGFRIGGAEVSTKHANFIINTGDATAQDIELVMAHVQAEVQRLHGVMLQPEVHIVGEV